MDRRLYYDPTRGQMIYRAIGGPKDTHQVIRLDELAVPADTTTLNVTTTTHGLVPKLPNDSTRYFNGTGTWTVPAGGGGGTTVEGHIALLALFNEATF